MLLIQRGLFKEAKTKSQLLAFEIQQIYIIYMINMLQNREEAAHSLAKKLASFRGKNPLILAVPRGAVGMGRIVADMLSGDLDVILVHKIGHPVNAEFAIGAVDEDGQVYMDEEARLDQIPIKYLESERQLQWKKLKERRAYYTPVHKSLNPKGRIVIIIDDGIATGWTLKAGIQAIKERKPQRIIVAVGVASPQAIKEIENMVDEVVCLITPHDFYAVGQFYQDFAQVSDQEVIKLLAR